MKTYIVWCDDYFQTEETGFKIISRDRDDASKEWAYRNTDFKCNGVSSVVNVKDIESSEVTQHRVSCESSITYTSYKA